MNPLVSASRQSGLQLSAQSQHHLGASFSLAQRHYISIVSISLKNLKLVSTFRGEDHFLLLIESLVEEAALKTLPDNKQGNGDQHRPLRCNRAALGDRIKSLLTLAMRPNNDRRLMKELRRALDAIAKDRQPVRRPGRGRKRQCLSQLWRWRFKKSAAKAA